MIYFTCWRASHTTCKHAILAAPKFIIFQKSDVPFNSADHAPYLWPAANATVDSSSSALFVNADGEKFYLLEGVMYNADACAAWAWICFCFLDWVWGLGFW